MLIRIIWTLFENGKRKIMPTQIDFDGVRHMVKPTEQSIEKNVLDCDCDCLGITWLRLKYFNAIEICHFDGYWK